MSVRIDLQGLANTRDLGGMRTRDGRVIVSGKLIRSGHLHHATPDDITRLAELIGLVVDFRGEWERQSQPDPSIPGAENIHLPVSESLALGQAQDGRDGKNAFDLLAGDPAHAREYMLGTYLELVTSEYPISQYRRFTQLLADPPAKAILWHCTAGKDRAGFAAVIVQEILGVDREAIFEDYLGTNEYLAPEIAELRAFIEGKLGHTDERTSLSLDYLFDAREEYLAAVYEEIDKRYGGFDGFISQALCIDDATRQALQNLYTE